MLDDEEELEELLRQLKTEHTDLDIIVSRLIETPEVDFLRLQRLKKRKLVLKDQILRIESMLLPDIIA